MAILPGRDFPDPEVSAQSCSRVPKADEHWYLPATVISVIDGATVDAVITLPLSVSTRRHIRLAKIDVAPSHGPTTLAGLEARNALQAILEKHSLRIIVRVAAYGLDSHGRVLGTAYAEDFGNGRLIDVCQAMVQAGHAVQS